MSRFDNRGGATSQIVGEEGEIHRSFQIERKDKQPDACLHNAPRRGTTTEDGNSTSLGLGTGKIFKLRAQPGLAAVGSNLCTSLKHIMISNSRSWKQLSRQNGGGVKAAGEGWETAPPKRNPLEITD